MTVLTTADEMDFFQNLEVPKETIEALHNVFTNAQGNITTWTTSRDMIPVDILLEFLGIDRTPFARRCFKVAEHDHIGAIDFLNFAQTVYKFCPAGKPKLIEYVFVMYDPDKNGVLWLDEVVNFLEDQYGGPAGVSANMGAIKLKLTLQKMFKNQDFSDGGLDQKQLYKFIVKYPRFLYPAIQFQNQLKHDVLGIRHWDQWNNRGKISFFKRLLVRLKISKKDDKTKEEKNGEGGANEGEDGEDEDGDEEDDDDTGESKKRARGGNGLQKKKNGKGSKASNEKKGGKWNSGRSRVLNFGGKNKKGAETSKEGVEEDVDHLGENTAGEEMLGVLRAERAKAQAAANKKTQEGGGGDGGEASVAAPDPSPEGRTINNTDTIGGGSSAVAIAREKRKTRDTNREGASSRRSRLGREGSARSPQARSPAKIAAGVVDDALDPVSGEIEQRIINVQSDTVQNLGGNGGKRKSRPLSASSRSSEGSRRGTSGSPSRSPSARVPASLRAASLRRQTSSLTNSNTTDTPKGTISSSVSGPLPRQLSLATNLGEVQDSPGAVSAATNDSSPPLLHPHVAESTISESPHSHQAPRRITTSSGSGFIQRSPSRRQLGRQYSEQRLTTQAYASSPRRSPSASSRRITSGTSRPQSSLFRQPSNLTQEGESPRSGVVDGGSPRDSPTMRGPPSQLVRQNSTASGSAASPRRRPTTTIGRASVYSAGSSRNRGLDLRHGARSHTTLRKENSVRSIHSDAGSASPRSARRTTQRPASHAGPTARRGTAAAEAGSQSPSAKSRTTGRVTAATESPLARLRSTTVPEPQLAFRRIASGKDSVTHSPSTTTTAQTRGGGRKSSTEMVVPFDANSYSAANEPDRMSGVVVAGVQFSDGEEDADQGDAQRITIKKSSVAIAK